MNVNIAGARSENDCCHKCGENEHWYPTGIVGPFDTKRQKYPVTIHDKAGHCLKCGHEEPQR